MLDVTREDDSTLKELAHEFASISHAAGTLLKALQSKNRKAWFKTQAELVTAADLESHALLCGELSHRFPGIPLILEEQPNPDILPECYIAADELDGSALYSKGLPDWGVTLAYVENGRPVAGVLHQPALDRTVVTWRGGGTWNGETQIKLKPDKELGNNIILLEMNRHLNNNELAWFGRLSAKALATRSLATSVASAMELLHGQCGLYINCRGAKVWDFAAGALAVEEAGGVAKRPDGSNLSWDTLSIGVLLAADRKIARDALALSA